MKWININTEDDLPKEKAKELARPLHIQRLFDEANKIDRSHSKYWELRCVYYEKSHDPTYSNYERNNCYQLWRILTNK